MSAVTIKQAIKTNLDDLVTAGVLGGATIADLKKDPLAGDIARFPHAFLMPPSINSEISDNKSLVRTYVYDIMIVWKAENLASSTALEEAIETVLSKFDNDPTLGGQAMGGVLPVSLAPQPFQHQAQQLIMAIVQIEAKDFTQLTFG
jgi:hypothetical protein